MGDADHAAAGGSGSSSSSSSAVVDGNGARAFAVPLTSTANTVRTDADTRQAVTNSTAGSNDHKRNESGSDGLGQSSPNSKRAGQLADTFSTSSLARKEKDFMAEDELLALVVEIKLQTGQPSSRIKGDGGTSGAASGRAGASTADTIDLCHRKIQTLPPEMVDIIKDDLVRLALGYNFITTLPSTFVELSRLRYLNVRANYLSVIPSVITELPALEILDISRNKIRRLPSQPGRLLDLRVLSISNNRLKTIPTWIAQAKHLRIFKVESNPVVWPPPHISVIPPLEKATVPGEYVEGSDNSPKDKMEARKRAEDRQMMVWITQLKSWLEENESSAPEELQKGESKAAMQAPTALSALSVPTQSPDTAVESPVTALATHNMRDGERRTVPDGAVASAAVEDCVEEKGDAEAETTAKAPVEASKLLEPAEVAEKKEPQETSEPTRTEQSAEGSLSIGSAMLNVDEGEDHDPDDDEGEEQKEGGKANMSNLPPQGADLGAGANGAPHGADESSTEASEERSNLPRSDKTSPKAADVSIQKSDGAAQSIHDTKKEGTASFSSPVSSPPRSHVTRIESESQQDVSTPKAKSFRKSRRDSDGSMAQPTAGTTLPGSDERAGPSEAHIPATSTPVSIVPASERDSIHNRNNSHTLAQPSTPQPPGRVSLMRTKKSLPDLRQNHGTILMERVAGISPITDSDSVSQQRNHKPLNSAAKRPPLPQSVTDVSISTRLNGVEDSHRRKLGVGMLPDSASLFPSRRPSDEMEVASGLASPSGNKSIISAATNSAAAVESERNSYFKRLSTLPASSISKSISIPVLLCVDATRSVLYALSQVHTALKHYVTFATDERMTSQLSRVLDIAGGSMAKLIQSLDRFDSLSRMKGGSLDPIIVRGVITASIESIATFRKLVHVVHLQLKSLQNGADTRYSRTLLLLLYGSLGEVASSWATMQPLLDEVATYLSTGVQPHYSSIAAPNLPSIAESTSPVTPSSARSAAPLSRPHRRRHAGSFSAKDVAHGAAMPPGSPQSIHNALSEEGHRSHRPPALTSVSEPRILQYQAVQGGPLSALTSGSARSLRQQGSASSQSVLEAPATGKRADGTDGNVTSGSRSALPLQGYPMYGQSSDQTTLPIDDHLLLLVVKITSVAFSVWAGIEEHLISVGLPIVATGATKVQEESVESNLASTSANTTLASAATPMLRNGSEMSLPTDGDMAQTESDSAAFEARSNVGSEFGSHSKPRGENQGSSATPQTVSPTTQRRLRQLYDLARGVNEHTHRLQSCLERAQDAMSMTPTSFNSPPLGSAPAMGGSNGQTFSAPNARHGRQVGSDAGAFVNPDVHEASNSAQSSGGSASGGDGSHVSGSSRAAASSAASLVGKGLQQAQPARTVTASEASRELFVESGHFIKSILQISHFIKSLAAEGLVLPKYVRASLAELTTCARDLTLHLHFLSGPSPLQMPLSAQTNPHPRDQHLQQALNSRSAPHHASQAQYSQQGHRRQGSSGPSVAASAAGVRPHVFQQPSQQQPLQQYDHAPAVPLSSSAA